MVSQLPAWTFMDRLPIFDDMSGGYFNDEEEDELFE
jgi:hypothetical protein